MRPLVRAALAALLLVPLACEPAAELEPEAAPAVAPQSLLDHSAEFEQRVYEVTDGVHQAVGFDLANSILV